MGEHEDLGYLDYLVIGFDSAPVPADGFEELHALEAAGRIDIIDVEFVGKDDAGRVSVLTADEIGVPGIVTDSLDIIDADDLAAVGELLRPGAVAAYVVIEDLTLLPVIETWRRTGGSLLATGPVGPDDLVEVIDAKES